MGSTNSNVANFFKKERNSRREEGRKWQRDRMEKTGKVWESLPGSIMAEQQRDDE